MAASVAVLRYAPVLALIGSFAAAAQEAPTAPPAAAAPAPEKNLCATRAEPVAVGSVQWNGWGRDLSNTRYQPEPAIRAMDVPKLKPEIMQKARSGDIRNCFADITKARDLLGFEPRHRLEDTLEEIVGWVRDATFVDRGAEMKRQLETRKAVERAKGILQRRQSLTEEEAYLRMRNESRRLRRPMKELAEAIILSEELSRKESTVE